MVFEMPLEQLKTYTGSTPCPPDFDEYWQQALKEMEDVDPQVEIERDVY
ncbi:MAG: acetylxylan esterase [Fervidobacterium sp.]